MKTSTDRILTTHVGSLPRPADLLDLLMAKETGSSYDPAAYEARVAQGVSDIVAKQVEAGIDSVSDGEPKSKIMRTRSMSAIASRASAEAEGVDIASPPQTGGASRHPRPPRFHGEPALRADAGGGTSWFASAAVPYCTGPVSYADRRPVDADLKNLAAAVATHRPGEAFMNAASRRRPHCKIRPRPLSAKT